MRPIDKGTSVVTYTTYGDARHDLAAQIGYYCSYCEMGTNNMIEVEHVHPIHHGGDELDWGNFLLSCKYCNTIKSDNNVNRTGYFWADIDNTDLLFDYTLDERILVVKTTLTPAQQTQANALIKLVGLNRYPKNAIPPTEADTRWRLRDEVRTTAMSSYNRWYRIRDDIGNPSRIDMAEQIAETSLIGFYSVWCKIFEFEQTVLDSIDLLWQDRFNNFKQFDPVTGLRLMRHGGQI